MPGERREGAGGDRVAEIVSLAPPMCDVENARDIEAAQRSRVIDPRVMRDRRARPRAARLLVALLCLTACKSAAPFQKEARWPTPSAGAVASEHPLATKIGLDILAAGGNAADAAVATALALAVVYPQAGNLGGGGFALWVPHTGAAVAIDFRETAPAAAHPGRYLGADGKRIAERSLTGPLAVGVPGSPAGLYEVWQRFGSQKFTFAELARPALSLASSGFIVDAWLARDLAAPGVQARMNASALEVFFPRGEPLREGMVLRQPVLAETLGALGSAGPRAFYSGGIADSIVDEVAATAVPEHAPDGAIRFGPESGRGWITLGDLAGYRTAERVPLRGWFRGMEIVTMPPPSSGGIVALQVLGVLEGLPLDAERTRALAAHALEQQKSPRPTIDDPGLDERMLHWWIEAFRRAFADRAVHMGDPDHVTVPVRELLSPASIAARRVSIGESAAIDVTAWAPPAESEDTTHLSVLDVDGNAVSLTTTLNGTFGSGILVRGGGFLLNNELDDFAIEPGSPNLFGLVGGTANALLPEKRPLSSMTPIVVRDGGHATVGVLGSPGGPKIITALVEVLLRLLVLEQPIEAAIRAPRLHQQWSPSTTEFEPGFDPALIEALENRRGHPVTKASSTFGSVQAIWLSEPGARPVAISDPRRGGSAGVVGSARSNATRPLQ